MGRAKAIVSAILMKSGRTAEGENYYRQALVIYE